MALDDAVEKFLDDKLSQADLGEINHRTYRENRGTCQRFVDHIGAHRAIVSLTPADYREEIDRDRLVAVTDYVRCWLFSEPNTNQLPLQAKTSLADSN